MANKNQNTGDAQGSTLTSEQIAAAELAAAEKAEAKAEAEKNNKKSVKSPYDKLIKEYAALYPEVSEFHITTDAQVFLPSGLGNAKNHQHTLGKGEVTTIKVK